MKGNAAVVAIVLIVVAIVAVFVYFGQGGGSISFPGFTSIQPITYSNDVISVSDKFISDKSPFDGQKTTIELVITNKGQGTTEDIEFVLEPPTGFTSDVKCGEGSCKFDLEEGEAMEVVVTLNAVSLNQILPVNVRYFVTYPYSGEREVHIPIVSDKDNLPKGQSYFVSESTYGPIQVSVTPPQSREAGDGSSSIFAVSGIPVKLDFGVSDVAGGFLGGSEVVTMKGDDLKLTLSNLDIIFCDNIDEGTNSLKGTDKGFEVPFQVSCTFEPSASGDLSDGVVKIEYDYVYKISFTDQFTIIPRESAGIPLESGSTETESGSTGDGIGGSTGTSPGTPIETIEEIGESSGEMTLSTDKGIYSSSETVSITGSVSSGSGTVVTGRIFSPNGNLHSIFQEQSGSSGSFSSTFVLPSAADSGTWRIIATSGSLEKERAISVN